MTCDAGTTDDAALPDDAVLLERGVMAPPPDGVASDRIMIVACGALAREILAVIRLNGWTHMDLECLPARLHNRPERIPEAVRARIRAARARGYAGVKVLYAECGAGWRLDAVCAEEGAERMPGPNCYALFDGFERHTERMPREIGALYLTDFLTRQFDALVWRGLGLDRHPELIEMLFGHYDRLVYLAQTEDKELETQALRAALALGLPFERRFTGYGDLARVLAAPVAP